MALKNLFCIINGGSKWDCFNRKELFWPVTTIRVSLFDYDSLLGLTIDVAEGSGRHENCRISRIMCFIVEDEDRFQFVGLGYSCHYVMVIINRLACFSRNSSVVFLMIMFFPVIGIMKTRAFVWCQCICCRYFDCGTDSGVFLPLNRVRPSAPSSSRNQSRSSTKRNKLNRNHGSRLAYL